MKYVAHILSDRDRAIRRKSERMKRKKSPWMLRAKALAKRMK